jgi:hypothetical protein
MPARPVLDVDVIDGMALAQHQRRQKTVVVVEERQPQVDLAADRLEAARGVAGAVGEESLAQPVGEPRGALLEEPVVARGALAGDEGDPRVAAERGDQRRQETRVVLAVAVDGDDDGAAGGERAGADRNFAACANSKLRRVARLKAIAGTPRMQPSIAAATVPE